MRKILIVVLLALYSSGAIAATASLLVYQVWETGVEPYVSRILVTPDYLRLDEGSGADGFTLFDREQEIIYNVVPEEHSVLVLDLTETVPELGDSLILHEEVVDDGNAPLVAGRQPKNVRLLANGEECARLVVVEGLMQDAVDALGEMKEALARVQAATMAARPLRFQTPCDLAVNVHAPARSLSFGLPLQERSEGRSQSLVDFSADFDVDDALFDLPPGFSRRPLF